MKRFLRILLVIAAWAGITYLFREKLLPLPKPDPSPPPHFRPAAQPKLQLAPPLVDAPDEAPRAESTADDLTEVKGIGPVYQHRLAEIGIVSFAGLAAGDATTIAEKIEVSETQVREWMDQARSLAE